MEAPELESLHDKAFNDKRHDRCWNLAVTQGQQWLC